MTLRSEAGSAISASAAVTARIRLAAISNKPERPNAVLFMSRPPHPLAGVVKIIEARPCASAPETVSLTWAFGRRASSRFARYRGRDARIAKARGLPFPLARHRILGHREPLRWGQTLPNLIIALIRIAAELNRSVRFDISRLINDEDRQ